MTLTALIMAISFVGLVSCISTAAEKIAQAILLSARISAEGRDGTQVVDTPEEP
jgi:hypothetical protein